MIKEAITKLSKKENLTYTEAEEVMKEVRKIVKKMEPDAVIS